MYYISEILKHLYQEKKDTDKDASEGKKKLSSWLNKSMKVKMTDGRTLIGKLIIFFFIICFIIFILIFCYC